MAHDTPVRVIAVCPHNAHSEQAYVIEKVVGEKVTVPKLVKRCKLVSNKEDGYHANQNVLAQSRS